MTLSFNAHGADCATKNEFADPFGGSSVTYVPNSTTVSQCSEFIVMGKNEYNELQANNGSVDISEFITPTDIAESFTWGFGTYIFFWWLGFVVKTARMTIRRM